MKIKEFTEFSLESPGCVPGATVYRAHFKLGTDISLLFPYINAVAEAPVYHDKPHHIIFTLVSKGEATLNQCPEINHPGNKNADKLQAILS